jgi:hypothetical protein
MSFNVQSFCCTYNTITYIHGAFPLALLTPCWFSLAPFCVPFYLLGTLQLGQESSTSLSGCL